jgi:tRNA (guanine37-N1)-methyltransferase
MNLPASAPEFLDAFRGWTSHKLPEIHVHCFASKLESADQEAIDRCQVALGCEIANAKVHVVRDVSPKKNMYCVSFVLPEAARSLERITIQPRQTEVTEEPCAKKSRVS